MARLSHHLGKGRLMEWTAQPLKPLSQILLLLFIMILFDFTNPKITPLIVLPTPSMAPFPRQTLFQCHSNSSNISKCVINRNTFLEWNCNEYLSLHKMASLDESFILFFNALTIALVQVNAAIRERSLVWLITAIEIFAKSPCSASR